MTTERIGRRDFLVRAFAFLAVLAAPEAWAEGGGTNFKRVYLDTAERDRFYLFLQNIYRLYPEDRFHQRILELTREKGDDRAVYAALLQELPRMKPFLAELRFDVPALHKQKIEMSAQIMALLGPGAAANGYLELGSYGRYHSELKRHARLSGPVYLFDDHSPSYSPMDIAERRAVWKTGVYVPMGDYEPVPATVPDASVDLIVNMIGFHHAPAAKLAPFAASLRRVLRPDGRMIVRDHDVDSRKQDVLTALAHDVFNAGLLIPWEETARQVRLFRSLRDWTAYLKTAGFKRSEKLIAQAHDPTQNLLAMYTKA